MSDLHEGETRAQAASRILRAMADKCDKNDGPDFAGVAIIIPPQGEHVSHLMLDSKLDPAIFWANIKTKADIEIATIQQQERLQDAKYTGRR